MNARRSPRRRGVVAVAYDPRMDDLAGQQVAVTATDADAAAVERLAREAGATVRRLAPLSVPHAGTDVLMVDEWTAQDAPAVRAARAAGIRVSVLAELLLQRAAVPTLAITGTAGKSTTARLAAIALRAAGEHVTITPHGRADNAWPNAELVDETPTTGWFVAELTSTHLCHMDDWTGPTVGVVTNLWPDHLELHAGLAGYVAAKRRLVTRTHGTVVLNRDDPGSWALRDHVTAARLTAFAVDAPIDDGLRVDGDDLAVVRGGVAHAVAPWRPPPWAHPSAALAACAAAVACGVDASLAAVAIAAAPGLAHRLAPVTSVAGIAIIDDSLAATPAKAMAALARMPPGRTVVVMGGHAAMGGVAVHASTVEHAALQDACTAARDMARTVVLFGEAADRLAPLLAGAPLRRGGDIGEAIAIALGAARPGDVVVVCPAFPLSMDERRHVADPASWQAAPDPTG